MRKKVNKKKNQEMKNDRDGTNIIRHVSSFDDSLHDISLNNDNSIERADMDLIELCSVIGNEQPEQVCREFLINYFLIIRTHLD